MIAPKGDIDLSRCRVLVVEDQLHNQRLVQTYLEVLGIRRIRIANNGLEGLAALEAEEADLVVLDIMMPVMDGIEMLGRLRGDSRWADLPVLVQTALGAVEERAMVFRAGATDLVTKPLNTQEFLARVRIHLENRVLVRSLQDYQARVSADLELASQTQSALLPTDEAVEALEARFALVLDSHAESSTELGGDIWGAFPLDDGRLCIYSADFSGHGINAALNTLRLHTLIEQNPPADFRPDAWLSALGARLTALLPVEQYATMFLGILDCAAGRLAYATAGAPRPILGDGSGQGTRFLEGGGLPLGIVADWSYEAREVDFPPGSFLFLYSDALLESPLRDGTVLDDDGVMRLVQAVLGVPSSLPPLDRLIEGFRARVVLPIPDDLTAVWLARR
ncbi:MAG: fused response regulator/phosphatase [Magnetospirillum sp. WYHS-4]